VLREKAMEVWGKQRGEKRGLEEKRRAVLSPGEKLVLVDVQGKRMGSRARNSAKGGKKADKNIRWGKERGNSPPVARGAKGRGPGSGVLSKKKKTQGKEKRKKKARL